MTASRWQQFLLCITWVWPVMTVVHSGSAGKGDLGGAIFWGLVWGFCAIRLQAKGHWPFPARNVVLENSTTRAMAEPEQRATLERQREWMERTRDPIDSPEAVKDMFERVDELRNQARR